MPRVRPPPCPIRGVLPGLRVRGSPHARRPLLQLLGLDAPGDNPWVELPESVSRNKHSRDLSTPPHPPCAGLGLPQADRLAAPFYQTAPLPHPRKSFKPPHPPS